MTNIICTNCKAGILCTCKKKKKNVEFIDEHVNHPKHYLKDSGHEVIDVIKAWKLNFELGNAIKYIARCGKKDVSKSKEDLEKAIWYIQYHLDNS